MIISNHPGRVSASMKLRIGSNYLCDLYILYEANLMDLLTSFEPGMENFLKTLLKGKNKKQKPLIKQKTIKNPKNRKNVITKSRTKTKINYSIIHD